MLNFLSNPDNIYKTIDILLKIILGVIVVLYINNRNNKTKKKEILYNLYVDLVKNAKRSNEFYQNIIELKLLKMAYDLSLYDQRSGVLEYLEKLLKKTKNKLNIDYEAPDNYEIALETIKLILGKFKSTDKIKNCSDKDFFISLFPKTNFSERDQIIEKIIELINKYLNKVISEYELEYLIEQAKFNFIFKQQKEIQNNFKTKIRPCLNSIKIQIDRM